MDTEEEKSLSVLKLGIVRVLVNKQSKTLTHVFKELAGFRGWTTESKVPRRNE